MFEPTSRPILLAFVLLSLLALAPLLLTPYPSLDDYFHHLARMHILQEGAAGELAQYYRVEWEVLPNLAMDLIVPALATVLSLEDAGRLFVGLALVLILSGTMALHAALHGRLTWWPLLVCLILWNRVFLYGFVNYVFTLGLMLWALAAWVYWRERGLAFRLPVFVAIATVLFFGHLAALGVYALAVGSYELTRWWDHRPAPARLAADAAVAIGQFVPAAAVLLATSPTGEFAAEIGYVEQYLQNRLRGFHHLLYNYNLWFDRLVFVGTALAVLIGLLTRRIIVHRQMRLAIGLGLAVYMLMPDTLFDAGAAAYRLPVALACLFIAGSAPARLPAPRLIVAALLALFVLRMGLITERYLEFDRLYREVVATIREAVPEGASMLTLTARMPDYHSEFHQPQLMYASGLAIIERAAFDPSFATFAHPGKQPVRLRAEYRELVDELDARLAEVDDIRRLTRTPPLDLVLPEGANPGRAPAPGDDLLEAFDVVLLLYPEDASNPAPAHLEPLEIHPRFHLYRVL